MKSKDLLVGKWGPDGSPSSPEAMKFNDLLVGTVGLDGGPSNHKAMKSKGLLVGKGAPVVAPIVSKQ